jgi:hypothetical protein
MKPPKEVVSPVLTLLTISPGEKTYCNKQLFLPWMSEDVLTLRFENPARKVRLHVVPSPSRWTTTLTSFPILQRDPKVKGTILLPGVGPGLNLFLVLALRDLTGQDHGDVHFWVENL